MAHEVARIHATFLQQWPGVDRVAAALYDPATKVLRTFVHSDGSAGLERYEVPLAAVPSLQRLAETGQPRVLDELATLQRRPNPHNRWLRSQGFRSSYTLPFYDGGRFMGVLFLDSRRPGCFRRRRQPLQDLAHLAGLALVQQLAPVRLVDATLRVAARLTHVRDPETRSHLDRMAHYTHLIGRALASAQHWTPTDEVLEFLLLYAPLHDVGKIAIPDGVLLKPGPLTPAELEVMKSHVLRGAEIVEGILADLGEGAVPHAEMLRSLVLHHHEYLDGSGYPHGLVGTAIPIEARIATVADVLDALTSRRPYKAAWSMDEAMAWLREGAGRKYDPAVVAAAGREQRGLEDVRARFPDADGTLQSREGYDADL